MACDEEEEFEALVDKLVAEEPGKKASLDAILPTGKSFALVTPDLAVGGGEGASHAPDGFGFILDCSPTAFSSAPPASPVKRLVLDILVGKAKREKFSLQDNLPAILAFAREAAASGGKLFVRGPNGVNRAPAVAAAILVDRALTGETGTEEMSKVIYVIH